MTVADRIKALRIEKDITQTELAKRLGNKDKSTISKIESKGNDISLKDINRIAEALGTTPAYLMGWDGSEKLEYMNEDIANLIVRMREEGRPMALIKEYLRLSPQRQGIVDALVHSLLLEQHPELLQKDNPECN